MSLRLLTLGLAALATLGAADKPTSKKTPPGQTKTPPGQTKTPPGQTKSKSKHGKGHSSTTTSTTSTTSTLSPTSTASVVGPCDIYAAGDTPCVAAHSTTRALYGDFAGALYRVTRGSDNLTMSIYPITPGGVADSAKQDQFCDQTTCLIHMIHDQSGHGNDLTQAPSGGAARGQANGFDFASSAVGAPVTLNGQKAYGVFIQPGCGYRNDNTNSIAVANEAEGIYTVLDGTHYGAACCFDYGNAETDNNDDGAGTMEALYFGTGDGFGTGAGPGPWIMGDMENLLTPGQYDIDNPNDPTITYRFVHAIIKGNSTNHWGIRGGDAQAGQLSTFYSGPRPQGYYPMKKQGAIILGIGGDNSDGSVGTFYEGAMTRGYPSNATEDKVQANIVAAKYGTTSLTSGPPLTAGSDVSFEMVSEPNAYISHNGGTVTVQNVTSSDGSSMKEMATFKVVVGLAFSGCFSYESLETPGNFLRHSGYQLHCDPNPGNMLFAGDATFCPEAGLTGQGTSFRSFTYPTRYWRRYGDLVYIGQNGGPFAWDSATDYNEQATWLVDAPLYAGA